MPTNKKIIGIASYVSMDSFAQDPLARITPEIWEIAMPKINSDLKMPIIFGTGGDIEKGDKYYKELWDNAKSHDLGPGILPQIQHGTFEYPDYKKPHWRDPVEPIVWDKITEKDLEFISKNYLISRGRRVGGDSMSYTLTEKIKTLKQIESEIWLRDFPQAKRGSNYTKPKNRKKKKR